MAEYLKIKDAAILAKKDISTIRRRIKKLKAEDRQLYKQVVKQTGKKGKTFAYTLSADWIRDEFDIAQSVPKQDIGGAQATPKQVNKQTPKQKEVKSSPKGKSYDDKVAQIILNQIERKDEQIKKLQEEVAKLTDQQGGVLNNLHKLFTLALPGPGKEPIEEYEVGQADGVMRATKKGDKPSNPTKKQLMGWKEVLRAVVLGLFGLAALIIILLIFIPGLRPMLGL